MTLGQRVEPSNLKEIVDNGQCVGCGFCSIVLHADTGDGKMARRVEYEWLPEVEHYGPLVSENSSENTNRDLRICPGHSMQMPEMAEGIFGREPKDGMVGEALRIASGYASSEAIRAKAASGGIATALVAHLFKSGQIDECYCSAGYSPQNGYGFLARDTETLLNATGSHYHPIAFGAALSELVNGSGKFAFIGLPCEIAAMRQLMSERADIEDRCIILIGLFCGGINRYSGIGRYLSHFDVDPSKVVSIDYRDGEWPGQISVATSGEKNIRKIPRIQGNSRWNILRYMVSFQGYWMLPRCRICPDQIADFADIALGDPHLPRFKSTQGLGHSAIIARTTKGLKILEGAEAGGDIVLDKLSRDELVESQGYTLENRRFALVYANMWNRFRMIPPKVSVYTDLEGAMSIHQHIFAFVDLGKICLRDSRWLAPLYLPLQIFEYLFLTLSPRLAINRLAKLLSNR
jgi:coenzyme F420 hydrogenase subunit beta